MPTTSKIIIQRQSGQIVGVFSLGSGEHSVGRDTANAILAQSDYISRHHAKLLSLLGRQSLTGEEEVAAPVLA